MKKKIIRSTIIISLVLLSVFSVLPAYADDEDPKLHSLGDVTLDGAVSAYDARLIMRAAVGLSKLKTEVLCYADLDNDGAVSPADARATLRTSVSLHTKVKHLYTQTGYKEPLCNEEGYVQFICSDCKEEKKILLTSPDHDYALTSSTKATCVKKGEKIYTCTRCNDTYTEYTDTVAHKFTKPKIDDPSKCSVCGKINENSKMTEKDIVKDISGRVSKTEITKNMKAISGGIGARWYAGSNVGKAYNKLISILKSYGYTSSQITTDYFNVKGTTQKNIYCTIPAKTDGADVVLFCAHYDSASSGRGAVDNASGVCAVLEVARVLKALHMNFDKEVRICFFSGEEVGYYGAYRYCSYYYRSLPRHTFILNVDMAGHPKLDRNWYLCVSTEPSAGSVYPYRTAYPNNTSRTVDKAKKIIGSCGEDGYYSPVTAGMHDLVPFRKNGIKAATLSWRERDGYRGSGNDYKLASPSTIHTSYDTLSNISLTSVYRTTKLMAGAAGEILFPIG